MHTTSSTSTPRTVPVELPQRLIELHTYRNEVVLDPSWEPAQQQTQYWTPTGLSVVPRPLPATA